MKHPTARSARRHFACAIQEPANPDLIQHVVKVITLSRHTSARASGPPEARRGEGAQVKDLAFWGSRRLARKGGCFTEASKQQAHRLAYAGAKKDLPNISSPESFKEGFAAAWLCRDEGAARARRLARKRHAGATQEPASPALNPGAAVITARHLTLR